MWKAALYDYFWQLSCDLYYIRVGAQKGFASFEVWHWPQDFRAEALTRPAMSHGCKSFPKLCKVFEFLFGVFWFFFLLFWFSCLLFCCVAAFRVQSLFSFAFQSFPILLQVFRKKWHTICQQNVASPSVLAVTDIDVGGEGRGVTAAPSKINCKLAQVSGVYGRRDRPAGASEKFFYYKSRQNIANAANVNRKPRQSNAPKWSFLVCNAL